MELLNGGLDSFTSLVHGVVPVLQVLLSTFTHAFSTLVEGVGSLDFLSQANDSCDRCPGSSFTSVGAAWGTIGYAVQADLLYQLRETSFHHWAVLLYVMAAAGGIIGAAMGMPPKTYLWFFIGPGIFWWLIGATEDTEGVSWRVAGEKQKQSVVWRDSEVGLQNSNLFSRKNLKAYRDRRPDVNQEMRVANLFLYVDTLFSATSQALIGWTGIWKATGRGGNDTNLAVNEKEQGPWFIMANNKWAMMENLTSSYARNADVRDALITFMASECGDKFKQVIDASSYMAAGQLRRGIFPKTVFKLGGDPNLNGANESLGTQQYRDKLKLLDVTVTKTPPALVRLLEDTESPTSFGKFAEALADRRYQDQNRGSMIVCSEYLWVLVQALRWEAGNAYWQLMRSAPLGPDHNQIIHSLYNGWNVRLEPNGNVASLDEMHHLTRNLIFVHMLRNELVFAPQVADTKYSPAEQSRQYGESYARQVGAKSKYTELIQWALLMPHLQGILYFLLAAAYPLAALMVLVPNWYKSMFTWMSFMAWIKLWDVGFALVMMMERSVWAMMGNNSHVEFISRRVLQMSKFDSIGASCPDGTKLSALDGTLDGLKKLCAVPVVCSTTDLDCNGSGKSTSGNNTYSLLDQALMLGAGSDLDLTNSYYLYIMAALYFAVPAVAGQLVLGAKAGAAGMVQNMIGGISGEVGKAAVTGHQGVLSHIAAANQASVGQQATIKALKSTGFAEQALAMSNAAIDMGREGDFIGAKKTAWEKGNQAFQFRNNDFKLGAQIRQSEFNDMAMLKALEGMPRQSDPVPGSKAADKKGGSGGGGAKTKPQGMGGSVAAPIKGLFEFHDSWAHELGKRMRQADAVSQGYAWQPLTRTQAYMDQDHLVRSMSTLGAGADLEWQAMASKQFGSGFSEGGRRAMGYAQGAAAEDKWAQMNNFGLGMIGNASVIGNVQSGAMGPRDKPQDFDYLAQGGFLGASTRQQSMYPGTSFIFDSAGRAAAGRQSLGSSYMWGLWNYNMDDVRQDNGLTTTSGDAGRPYESNLGKVMIPGSALPMAGTLGFRKASGNGYDAPAWSRPSWSATDKKNGLK